jgi:hypothetical protein
MDIDLDGVDDARPRLAGSVDALRADALASTELRLQLTTSLQLEALMLWALDEVHTFPTLHNRTSSSCRICKPFQDPPLSLSHRRGNANASVQPPSTNKNLCG